jgi:2-polyprenyl-3-methyl-5-hydroxy-6-metoxy-1,4-benzoquinol methylase
LENTDIKNQVITIKCDLCGSDEFSLLFNGSDYLSFSPLVFELKKCKKCGLVNLNPRPENITYFYEDYRKGPSGNDIFDFLAPNRIKKIEKFKNQGVILDIGCGQGGFLSAMKKNGWETYGVELNKEACNFARYTYGLENINNNDLLSTDFPDNFFDVVTLWHVFEHLRKPQDTLKKIYKILKVDGLLIIESPNFNSLQSRVFKDRWFNLDLPRHLYQFSPAILKQYFNKTNFTIIKRDYFVNPLINLVSLKKSLLRSTGVLRAPNSDQAVESSSTSYLHRYRLSRKIFSFALNIGCLLISTTLNLIGCDDSFRVYCQKK